MNSKRFIIILSSLFVIALVGCSNNSTEEGQSNEESVEVKEVRFAVEGFPDSVQHKYALKFKEVIEEKSNGGFSVNIYTGGELGTAEEQIEQLQAGGIEFSTASALLLGNIVPENQLFSISFLLPEDIDDVKRLFSESKALNEMLSEKYMDNNIQVLSYWPEGYMHWTANKEIHAPEDMKGLKMRSHNSRILIEAYKSYGANATPMPYEEVYSALQLGLIDGQENPISAIYDAKFYEVQDNLILSYHNLYVITTVVNPEFFESLSEEDQQIVLETVEELNDYAFSVGEEEDNARLEQIKEDSDINVYELTDEEREKFREASGTTKEKYIEFLGEDGEVILNELEKEIEELN